MRRAFQDLVSDCVVYRVPRRGAYATEPSGPCPRQLGSIEDLMSLSEDTKIEVLTGLTRRVDVDAASRLRLDNDVVCTVVFRRLHDGVPFVVTTVHLPETVARSLPRPAALTKLTYQPRDDNTRHTRCRRPSQPRQSLGYHNSWHLHAGGRRRSIDGGQLPLEIHLDQHRQMLNLQPAEKRHQKVALIGPLGVHIVTANGMPSSEQPLPVAVYVRPGTQGATTLATPQP